MKRGPNKQILLGASFAPLGAYSSTPFVIPMSAAANAFPFLDLKAQYRPLKAEMDAHSASDGVAVLSGPEVESGIGPVLS